MDSWASPVGDEGNGWAAQRQANQTENFSVLDTWAPMAQLDGRCKQMSKAEYGCQDKYFGVILSCAIQQIFIE